MPLLQVPIFIFGELDPLPLALDLLQELEEDPVWIANGRRESEPGAIDNFLHRVESSKVDVKGEKKKREKREEVEAELAAAVSEV
jgi:hypothetical protein